MTIEKRGVMYWINFVLLTLFNLALIGLVTLLTISLIRESIFAIDDISYAEMVELTYIIIMGIAALIMIVGLVFYLLKKLRIFAYLMTAFYIAITAMFIHGFDRAHLYIFSKYNPLLKTVVVLLIVMLVIAILSSLVLNGAFGKTMTKIISLISVIISIVSIAVLGIIYFNLSDPYPYTAYELRMEIPWSFISLAFFSAPIFAISLWLFITTIRNRFSNFEDKEVNEKVIVAEENVGIEGAEPINTDFNQEQASAPQEQPTAPPQQPAENIVNNVRFCANCGAQLQEGVAFCPNCGAPCEIPPQPQQPQIDMTAYKEKKERTKKKIVAFVPILASFVIAIIAIFIGFRPPQPTGIFNEEDELYLNPISAVKSTVELECTYTSDYYDLMQDQEAFNIWYGSIKYDSDDDSIAYVDDGVVNAESEGVCRIKLHSKANIKNHVEVYCENNLQDLYDEAGCDPSWATISDDGETVTFDMLEDSSETVPAAEYFRSQLHFTEDYDYFWGEILPDSIYYDDSGSFESDVATCTWEYTTYYYLSNTLEVKFTLN